MKKKRKNYTKAKNLSFNNPRNKFELDRISYQNYQRKQYTNEKSIDINHLENAFYVHRLIDPMADKIIVNNPRNLSSFVIQLQAIYSFGCLGNS